MQAKNIKRAKRVLALLMAFGSIGNALPVNAEGYPETQTVPHNPYVGGWHNCTWGAWQLAYEYTGIALPGWHNAGQWAYDAANSGYTVSNVPAVGTIIVWSNHVAFVTDISEDGSKVYVKEGNYSGDYNEQWVDAYGPRGWQQLIGYIYLPNVDTSNIPEIYHGDLLDKAVNVYISEEERQAIEKEKQEKAELERRQKLIEEEKERVTFDDNISESESVKREDKEAKKDIMKEDTAMYGLGGAILLSDSSKTTNGFVKTVADTFGEEMEFITILPEETQTDETKAEETTEIKQEEVNNSEKDVSAEETEQAISEEGLDERTEVVLEDETVSDQERPAEETKSVSEENVEFVEYNDTAEWELDEEDTRTNVVLEDEDAEKTEVSQEIQAEEETGERLEEAETNDEKSSEIIISNIKINPELADSMTSIEILSQIESKIAEDKENKREVIKEEAKAAIETVAIDVDLDSEKDMVTSDDLKNAVTPNKVNSREILTNLKAVIKEEKENTGKITIIPSISETTRMLGNLNAMIGNRAMLSK